MQSRANVIEEFEIINYLSMRVNRCHLSSHERVANSTYIQLLLFSNLSNLITAKLDLAGQLKVTKNGMHKNHRIYIRNNK